MTCDHIQVPSWMMFAITSRRPASPRGLPDTLSCAGPHLSWYPSASFVGTLPGGLLGSCTGAGATLPLVGRLPGKLFRRTLPNEAAAAQCWA